MTIKISFNDTPPAQALDLDTLREQQDAICRALLALAADDEDRAERILSELHTEKPQAEVEDTL